MHTKVTAAELLRVRLPLVTPFRAAHGTTAVKEALLVRVVTDAGVGWGECVAQVEPTYAPDTIESSRRVLRDELLPRVFAGAACDDVRGHAPARAALDCALLDARLRADGVSFARYLGATREYVPAGVAVGRYDDEAEFRALLGAYVRAGYRRVKCKIEPGHGERIVRAARAEVGADVELAADANGSYRAGTPDDDELRALDEFSLQCIEQPLGADALVEHAQLASHLRTPISLDETITSAVVARDAIALGAAAIVSVKPGRLGSIDEAVRVHDACVAAGIAALAGGMLETGVGRALLLAIAALPGFTATGDCSASERYFGPDGDLTEPFGLHDGMLKVPDGPGLGVEPRADRLAAVTIAREKVTP